VVGRLLLQARLGLTGSPTHASERAERAERASASSPFSSAPALTSSAASAASAGPPASLPRPPPAARQAVLDDQAAEVRARERLPLGKLRVAATRGDRAAAYVLGTAAYEGTRGMARDEAVAQKWWRRAADADLAVARQNVAWMLISAPGDPATAVARAGEAVTWLRPAAVLGHAPSQNLLVKALSVWRPWNGYADEGSASAAEAVAWLREAAAGGDASALEGMARWHWSGKDAPGFPLDRKRARELFRQADAAGLRDEARAARREMCPGWDSTE
jgi:TPR repeat protein